MATSVTQEAEAPMTFNAHLLRLQGHMADALVGQAHSPIIDCPDFGLTVNREAPDPSEAPQAQLPLGSRSAAYHT